MKKFFLSKSYIKRRPHGFTLIELILSIGLFSILFALLTQNTQAIYQFKDIIQSKKTMNNQMSQLLGGDLAGLIRSGFGIDYSQTVFDQVAPTSDGNYPEGLHHQVDQLSVFSNSIHTESFLIYREHYIRGGESNDTARLMVRFSNGETFPLHSSNVVIETFDISVPAPPNSGGDGDIHPYVELYVRARPRHPFGEIKKAPESSKNLPVEYRTTYMLRN